MPDLDDIPVCSVPPVCSVLLGMDSFQGFHTVDSLFYILVYIKAAP